MPTTTRKAIVRHDEREPVRVQCEDDPRRDHCDRGGGELRSELQAYPRGEVSRRGVIAREDEVGEGVEGRQQRRGVGDGAPERAPQVHGLRRAASAAAMSRLRASTPSIVGCADLPGLCRGRQRILEDGGDEVFDRHTPAGCLGPKSLGELG